LTDHAIKAILSKFQIQGEIILIKPFGSGNINDTYRVSTTGGKDYLLQRINHFVFKNVPGLMNNLVIVTEHLENKLKRIPGADADKEVLSLIETKGSGYFIEDGEGNFWRIFNFLADTKSYDLVTTETQAFEGGKAFGRFQALLADLNSSLLIDTIPHFHDIAYRLSKLDEAISKDAVNRLNSIQPELEFINERRARMNSILNWGENGIIPPRITHNDTKFNNVLLNRHDRAQCVIDLDTVMPGYVAYDFGDAIRTTINTAAEDEANLELIKLNIPLFTAYVKGYLGQTVNFLTEAEVTSLIEGALLLPYIQGVRFLTDYLDGDRYFKIHAPHHNLQRTRAQFQLIRKLEEAKEPLSNIIVKTWHDETR